MILMRVVRLPCGRECRARQTGGGTQFLLADLARGCPVQVFNEADMPGDLEGRQQASQRTAQRLGGPLPWVRDDERETDLAQRSSGYAITALAVTPASAPIAASTSAGWMFSPPEMITSLTRSVTQDHPSSAIRRMSPERYQPPVKASRVSAGRFQ
jgi:hypothetical protein